MRAKWRPLGFAALALLTALVIWIAARNARNATLDVPAARASEELTLASEGMPEYEITAAFDPSASTLSCTQTVKWTNDTGELLDKIVLRAYANAFASDETSPAASFELYDLCYGKAGFNPGGIDITSVMLNGAPADWSYADDARTIMYITAPPQTPGVSIRLSLEYTITIPQCAYRFGFSDGIYAIGNAFPILAIFRDGEWREDKYGEYGDPFVHECANWRVALTLPRGWQAAATGARTYGDPLIFEARAARDFALVISNRFSTARATVGGTSVTAYAASSGQARALVQAGARALEIYNEAFGEYPWPTYDLAAVSLPFGGMEYPCLSMISPQTDSIQLGRAVAHETAHQWFYSLAGSDAVEEPWLDESLCSFAALLYINKAEGSASLETYLSTVIEPSFQLTIPRGITIGSPLWAFAGWGEYRVLLYERGCGMLWGLSEAIGEQKLLEALRLYIDNASFGFASRQDFLYAIYQATGSDWEGYLIDYLDTYIEGSW
jgi:hypothetical protein